MNGVTLTQQCSSASTLLHKRRSNTLITTTTKDKPAPVNGDYSRLIKGGKKIGNGQKGSASFLDWTTQDVAYVAKYHWIPCIFAMGLLFFMGVEYNLCMVPASSPPFDLGFIATSPLHRLLASWPELNTLLAALNTVTLIKKTKWKMLNLPDEYLGN